MSQGLLVAHARSLNDLGQGVEDLTGHPNGLEKVRLTRRINHVLPRVIPVEIHHRLLEAQRKKFYFLKLAKMTIKKKQFLPLFRKS